MNTYASAFRDKADNVVTGNGVTATCKTYKTVINAVSYTHLWNVEVRLDVADMLKKVSPETKIIFGGPEVSFDDTEYKMCIRDRNRRVD